MELFERGSRPIENLQPRRCGRHFASSRCSGFVESGDQLRWRREVVHEAAPRRQLRRPVREAQLAIADGNATICKAHADVDDQRRDLASIAIWLTARRSVRRQALASVVARERDIPSHQKLFNVSQPLYEYGSDA